MYDYATVTKQNQIITLQETTNQKLDTINENIAFQTTITAILIIIILIRSITETCLGRRKY